MTEKYFLDTNFFVYCYSQDEKDKREKCLELLGQFTQTGNVCTSIQVVQEFCSVWLSKFQLPPLELKEALAIFNKIEIIKIDFPIIEEALDLHILHQFSLWDSLIISAARSGNCSMLITEDMGDGQVIYDLKIRSQFSM